MSSTPHPDAGSTPSKGGQPASVRFDPASPDLVADPFPTYAAFRRDHPVAPWSGVDGVWLVSRHDDVTALLAHPAARVQPEGRPVPDAYRGGPAEVMWRHNMALLDEPDHTRVRRSVARPLGRAGTDSLRDVVAAVAERTISDAVERRSLDAVTDLAAPVPRGVVRHLLGISDSEFDLLASWTPDFLRLFLPDGNSQEDVERIHRACGHFIEFFGELAERRRRSPRDDLTTEVVRAADAGALEHGEMIATLRGVFTAGFETTMATIAAFALCVASNPDLLPMLRERPDLIPPAVEELLRWESPVQVLARSFSEPVDVAGVRIPVGHTAWLLLGSANHDDAVHLEPERFVVDRAIAPHVSFGGGRHKCAGAALARLELELVIRAIVRDVGAIRLTTRDVRRRPHLQFRALQHLPVEIEPLVAASASRHPTPPGGT